MEDLFTLNALVSLITLALLEIVLGIDNVIFVSIILGRMSEQDRARGRRLWMIYGILMRCALLLGLTTLVKHGDTRRRMEFGAMTLAIVERQAMAGKAPFAGEGKHGGGIESAGKQDDSGLHGRMVANPAV